MSRMYQRQNYKSFTTASMLARGFIIIIIIIIVYILFHIICHITWSRFPQTTRPRVIPETGFVPRLVSAPWLAIVCLCCILACFCLPPFLVHHQLHQTDFTSSQLPQVLLSKLFRALSFPSTPSSPTVLLRSRQKSKPLRIHKHLASSRHTKSTTLHLMFVDPLRCLRVIVPCS